MGTWDLISSSDFAKLGDRLRLTFDVAAIDLDETPDVWKMRADFEAAIEREQAKGGTLSKVGIVAGGTRFYVSGFGDNPRIYADVEVLVMKNPWPIAYLGYAIIAALVAGVAVALTPLLVEVRRFTVGLTKEETGGPPRPGLLSPEMMLAAAGFAALVFLPKLLPK
jgi:hypothetical protein